MASYNRPEAGAAALALAHALTVAAVGSGAVHVGALTAALAQVEAMLAQEGLHDAAAFLAGVRSETAEQMRPPE